MKAKGQWKFIIPLVIFVTLFIYILGTIIADATKSGKGSDTPAGDSISVASQTETEETLPTGESAASSESQITAPETQATAKVTTAVTASPVSDKGSPDKKASFYCLGDNLIHGYVYLYAKSVAGGAGYDFMPIYENVASDISKADIAFINQETPITGVGEPEGYPNFNSPKEVADAINNLGFDVVNIATNHMLDRGTKGLEQFMSLMDSYSSFKTIGAYQSKEAAKNIKVIEKNGIKFAFLAFTYGLNGHTLSGDSGIYIPVINDADIQYFTGLAKNAADVVIVSMHWGNDSSQTVTSEQKRVARVLADCNVDVVIGHHSHTLLPVEWITRADGKQMLCTYSLGNAVSRMLESYCIVGGALNFDVEVSTTGYVSVTNVRMDPIITHYNKSKSIFRIYYFEDYSQSLLDQHGYEKDKVSYATMKTRIKNNISSEFLSDFYK